ncbi:MAG: FAD-dependent oxidoreductase [Devosiaceae bacterium]|nr:FAD-dependent oxidoreductase [Devosiaceae bacterium]
MAKKNSHRFAKLEGALFSGNLIERSKPLQFTLDGVSYEGFEGDTVLSALMGAGINTIGKISGEAIALDPRFCPPVLANSNYGKPQSAISMHRMPAINGLQLSLTDFLGKNTTSKRTNPGKILRTIWGAGAKSLNYNLKGHRTFTGLYDQLKIEVQEKFDLVVIGAGVAGLSAAREAINLGWRVALVEQMSGFGGDAAFFGAIEGENRPEDFVEDILKDIRNNEHLKIYLNAKAYFLNEESVRVHQVLKEGSSITTKVLELQTSHTILATGLLERLPVFCGNRLPGVKGARTAFNLAANYGLWQGHSSAFSTSSSPATQVALLANEMGVEIKKLADSRTNPKSRFFEFSKAYGISLAIGSQVSFCKPQKNNRLLVQFGLTADLETNVGDVLSVGSLIVCGGWQPNLNMWLNAGGEIQWSEQFQQLRATGELANVKLAGACSGAQSMSECAASGESAALMLQGKSNHKSSYFTKNTEHESEDGRLQISGEFPDMPARFLEIGSSFLQPEKIDTKKMWQNATSDNQNPKYGTNGKNIEYGLGDLATKIALKEIPEKYGALLAQERYNVFKTLDKSATIEYREVNNNEKSNFIVPNYLISRFGEHAKTVELKIGETRNLEIGCLIYSNQDNLTIKHAIGTVIHMNSALNGKVVAYLNIRKAANFPQVAINNGSSYSTAEIITDSSKGTEI